MKTIANEFSIRKVAVARRATVRKAASCSREMVRANPDNKLSGPPKCFE